eukprot:252774-Karenia_brevis.AAC.1
MHRHSAIQLPWKPFTVLSCDGIVTADPGRQLRELVGELEPYWCPSMQMPCLASPARGTLGAIEPDDLVRASKTFSMHTSTSLDGLHPRHFSLLCKEGVI